MYVFFMNDEKISPLGLISPKQVENYNINNNNNILYHNKYKCMNIIYIYNCNS